MLSTSIFALFLIVFLPATLTPTLPWASAVSFVTLISTNPTDVFETSAFAVSFTLAIISRESALCSSEFITEFTLTLFTALASTLPPPKRLKPVFSTYAFADTSALLVFLLALTPDIIDVLPLLFITSPLPALSIPACIVAVKLEPVLFTSILKPDTDVAFDVAVELNPFESDTKFNPATLMLPFTSLITAFVLEFALASASIYAILTKETVPDWRFIFISESPVAWRFNMPELISPSTAFVVIFVFPVTIAFVVLSSFTFATAAEALSPPIV